MTGPAKAREAAHIAALRGYARQRGVSEIEAIEIYEQELKRLQASAKVKFFISIIAEKIAKDAVRARSPDEDVHA